MLAYATIALDLSRERSRELDRAAARHRMLTELAGATSLARPGRIRTPIARALRSLSDAAESVSAAACSAATRLEGRSA
jgi:hypothetical protein